MLLTASTPAVAVQLAPSRQSAHAAVPAGAGAGLKHEHAGDIWEGEFAVDFFEVHAENYMGEGGPPHQLLSRIRADYPVSLHGVGLSIGAARPLDRTHLARLKALVQRYQPGLFSEHLAWSSHSDAFLNDLLPVPYNAESLGLVCDHVDHLQDVLQMRILLENPSTYVMLEPSTMTEIEFLRSVVRKTGCGLLLDVSNVHVSAVNNDFDALAYIDSFPAEAVGEVHLGGFAQDSDGEGVLLIDDHGSAVADAVWSLYRRALVRTGPVSTLIEWDNNVPPFEILAGEVARAKAALVAQAQGRSSPMAA